MKKEIVITVIVVALLAIPFVLFSADVSTSTEQGFLFSGWLFCVTLIRLFIALGMHG